MRTREEVDQELEHLEYAKRLLDERLAVVKQERDALREDAYAIDTATRRLAAFFKSHRMYIVDLQFEERTKEHYALAKQIWKGRQVLIPFIKSIPKKKATTFVYDLKGLLPDDANKIRNLCEVLAKKQWISYKKQKEGIEITTSLTGLQKNFISGIWAEEITLYLIAKTLKDFTEKRHLKYKVFWDLKLKRIYPETKHLVDMQLDLVAEVGDRCYVFETKSGAIHGVEHWVDRTRLFQNETHRFITCNADENLNPVLFAPLRLFSLQTLESQFNALLKEDFCDPA
jgi:hypothetical protein